MIDVDIYTGHLLKHDIFFDKSSRSNQYKKVWELYNSHLNDIILHFYSHLFKEMLETFRENLSIGQILDS